MAKYNWVKRLIDKITKNDCLNNNYFWYYNHEINLQSGTRDYVDCFIDKKHNFTFDFWTKELEVMTDCEEFNKAVISAFKELYGKITIIDETEDDDIVVCDKCGKKFSISENIGEYDYDVETDKIYCPNCC